LGQSRGGDFGRRLRGQSELELVDQQLQLGLGLGVAGEHDLASVGRRQMDVDHLDGGKLFQRAARGQSRRERVEPARQGDLQGIGEEGDEDMGFDSAFVVMEDRADRQVPFQVLEGFLDIP
jgi:hypothetical protein